MKRLVIAILVVLWLAVATNAQTFRGAINGTLTDPSGAVVPNAAVKVTEAATGIDRTTTTTTDGVFSFQDIPIGSYKVVVTASGFPAYIVDNVEVTAGAIYTLNVQLKMGGGTTTVEVSAAALSLDTTTQRQTMTITDEVIDAIPISARDFTQLIGTQPGYGGFSQNGFGSVNGARANQVDWQIDGVDNNDLWHNVPAVNQGGVAGIAGIILPMDSIAEFSSQTQSGAEAGRSAGGTVNITTKSGGNEIHGSAYYYNRNEAFAAHSPFFVPSAIVPKSPPLRNENYGFWLGGPFKKNKLFYSVGYEKQDFLIGLSGLSTEPSQAWANLALDILNNPGGKYGTYTPVPPSPTSQNLIGPNGYWPQGSTRGSIANLPATVGNYFSPVPAIGYSYNGVVKLDYNINDKHRIFFHWFGGQGNQIAPVGLSAALATASSIDSFYYEWAPIHVFNYSLVLSSTLSTRLTNQVLVGTNYFNQIFRDNNHTFVPGALGLKVSPDMHLPGASELQISGFDGVGVTNPNGRNDVTYHITDDVSYALGAHQMRFGAEVRWANVSEYYHRRGRGRFTFTGKQGPWFAGCQGATATSGPSGCQALISGGQLGNAESLADFLAGDVAASLLAVGNPNRYVRVNAVNAHFQDSWQITRNLNLNLGLRYEYFGPLHNGDKDLAFFVPLKGFVVQGVDINNVFPPDRRAFAPRLGFAYHANSFGGWVLRGGVGVYYDQINMNPFLDNHVGSDGLEGNPFGPKPYPLYTTNVLSQPTYNWDQTMALSPTGFIFPGIQTCADRFCLGPNDPKNLGIFSVHQNFRTPYFLNYSLQLEKALGDKVIAQIGYVGSEGRKLTLIGNIAGGPCNANGSACTQFNSVYQLSSSGTSNYNSLQAQLRTNSWHGLTTAVGFTWAHALDEISEYRGVPLDNAFDKHFDYGSSDYDTRRLFTVGAVYDVPKASWATGPWATRLWNGWQVSTNTNFHSGQPSDDVRLGLDLIGDPYTGANHSFVKGVGEQWWNGNAFAKPLPGTIGNLTRNKLYGPGFGTVDVSVIKNVPITERVRVQLRSEMFNIFNRKNLASIFGGVNSGCAGIPTVVGGVTRLLCGNKPGGFGWVQDTIADSQAAPGVGPGEPFQIQLAVKLIF
jgi:Carboxypeptidase regulatory-like domain